MDDRFNGNNNGIDAREYESFHFSFSLWFSCGNKNIAPHCFPLQFFSVNSKEVFTLIVILYFLQASCCTIFVKYTSIAFPQNNVSSEAEIGDPMCSGFFHYQERQRTKEKLYANIHEIVSTLRTNHVHNENKAV